MEPDELLGRIAARQRGRVTTAQLRGCGLDKRAVARRVRAGRLIPEHRGVFAVAHRAPIPFAAEQSALLACGDRVVLGRGSALAVRGLAPAPPTVQLVVPPEMVVRRRGISAQRSTLSRDEVLVVDGLRSTTVARAIADVAHRMTSSALDRLVAEAHARGLIDLSALERYAHDRPGAPALRSVLGRSTGMTRSQVERLFIRLVRDAGLPLPRTNEPVGPWEVDALWPDHRLAVELDVFSTHGHRRRFEADRRKEVALRAAGLQVRRYTDRQLTGEPLLVVADLASGLAAARDQAHDHRRAA